MIPLYSGEDQRHLKQVAVYQQLQLSLLQLHQALGNVQAQTASFGISGSIPPDKPLQQLIRVDVQLLP